MKKTIVITTVISVVFALVAVWIFARPNARMAAGYKAKIACSEIFVARRSAEDVIAVEFTGLPDLLSYFPVHIKENEKAVIVHGPLGLGKRRADFRDGYGCTLHHGGAPEKLPALARPTAKAEWPVAPDDVPLPDNINKAAINEAVDKAFSENPLGHRAVLVVVDGVIVGERYAPGFDQDTPMQSWSIAKSLTATLAGASVHAGYLDMDAPLVAQEWKGDPARESLRWDDLMRMASGLAFDENYFDATSDANLMLFNSRSAAAIAAAKPLAHEPSTHWSYSSGTTNILARAIAEALDEEGANLYSFAQEALFAPIGATSFVLEPDPSGNFIGSSFVYATARDWARLGQLYLDDGVVDGMRLLPADWVNYVRKQTPHSNDQYGAQFWLNHPDTQTSRQRFPGLPEEAYSMQGHEGQFVIMIPSENMIIVRLGVTRNTRPAPAIAPLFAELYDAVAQ